MKNNGPSVAVYESLKTKLKLDHCHQVKVSGKWNWQMNTKSAEIL